MGSLDGLSPETQRKVRAEAARLLEPGSAPDPRGPVASLEVSPALVKALAHDPLFVVTLNYVIDSAPRKLLESIRTEIDLELSTRSAADGAAFGLASRRFSEEEKKEWPSAREGRREVSRDPRKAAVDAILSTLEEETENLSRDELTGLLGDLIDELEERLETAEAEDDDGAA